MITARQPESPPSDGVHGWWGAVIAALVGAILVAATAVFAISGLIGESGQFARVLWVLVPCGVAGLVVFFLIMRRYRRGGTSDDTAIPFDRTDKEEERDDHS